jgi:hypothetical protein
MVRQKREERTWSGGWVVVILVKRVSGIGRATDSHGWVLQAQYSLWANVWIYAVSVARHLCRNRQASGIRRRSYEGEQKGWSAEEGAG